MVSEQAPILNGSTGAIDTSADRVLRLTLQMSASGSYLYFSKLMAHVKQYVG